MLVAPVYLPQFLDGGGMPPTLEDHMQGPYPLGTHAAATFVTPWEGRRMVRGMRYRVVRPFIDADGYQHPIGEEWYFVAAMFSPHDDDLLLAVKMDEHSGEWRIRLHWTPEAQESVIESFLDYVAPFVITRKM